MQRKMLVPLEIFYFGNTDRTGFSIELKVAQSKTTTIITTATAAFIVNIPIIENFTIATGKGYSRRKVK